MKKRLKRKYEIKVKGKRRNDKLAKKTEDLNEKQIRAWRTYIKE